jgi:hypothetical protein
LPDSADPAHEAGDAIRHEDEGEAEDEDEDSEMSGMIRLEFGKRGDSYPFHHYDHPIFQLSALVTRHTSEEQDIQPSVINKHDIVRGTRKVRGVHKSHSRGRYIYT